MKFKIGDILCLKTHPYTSTKPNVFLQGDASLISPIMTVVEVLNDSSFKPDKTEYDESTGERKNDQTQVKCVFYSHINHKYESNWFLNNQLRRIEEEKENEDLKIELKDIIGKNVILKTWEIELGKRKTSLKQNSYYESKENSITTAHLSFLPPLMTVIEIKKTDKIKEPNIDKLNGGKRRELPINLLKCKWYNPHKDSFSEDFLPLEILELQEDPDYNFIEEIENYINNSKYLIINIEKNKLLIKPLQLYFNHCYYELEYLNFISNNKEKIEILDLKELKYKVEDKYFIDEYPNKIEIEKDDTENEVKEELEKQKNKIFKQKGRKYFKIKYKDSHDNLTVRTINNFIKLNSIYFKAYCNLRKAERNFRFDGVLKVEVLNL